MATPCPTATVSYASDTAEYLRAQYYKAAQTTQMRKEENLCSLIQAKVHPDRLTSVSPPLKCALQSCHCQSPLRL